MTKALDAVREDRDVHTVLLLDWYAHEVIDRLLSAGPEEVFCGCGCDQAQIEAYDRLNALFVGEG
jgi:hypothetical protein